MHEVSESPEEWQGDYAGEEPLPTVHRRVMLTDLPDSGLEEIARRLKLTLPEAEPVPEPEWHPAPEPELELTPAPEPEPERAPDPEPAPAAPDLGPASAPVLAVVPVQTPVPAIVAVPEFTAVPAFVAVSTPVPMPAPAPAPVVVDRGPVLAGLTVAELEELAHEQFARVVHGPAEVPATDELYEHLRGAGLQRIDAFAYRVEDGRPVVVVRPSSAPEGARTLHRVVRTPAREAVWQVVDVWIGVPISTVRNPPADLLEAVYYAAY
ncbi:hypothetical protein Ais01nite_26130 [Asanoa ishikariensis]|uniref:Uncharacterized protein n=1 Tax=Asanoa ishikariensis TaxID=137265 RepID=A0A1H3QYV4_9ACTN|nr:hypothetical protein [Asanoa ishikariensis]GIF64578.1 hypothetical protein Ais01nite_26130 [Asanoa ishikariensis]SDZ18546.1 hypothetical protein SAMN05421684_3307 [Asanoa ishikariensis]